MFIKDNFIHSEYQKKTGYEGRIAILKKEIIRYSENGTGTEIFTLSSLGCFIITMSYDDVKKELTEKVC